MVPVSLRLLRRACCRLLSLSCARSARWLAAGGAGGAAAAAGRHRGGRRVRAQLRHDQRRVEAQQLGHAVGRPRLHLPVRQEYGLAHTQHPTLYLCMFSITSQATKHTLCIGLPLPTAPRPLSGLLSPPTNQPVQTYAGVPGPPIPVPTWQAA